MFCLELGYFGGQSLTQSFQSHRDVKSSRSAFNERGTAYVIRKWWGAKSLRIWTWASRWLFALSQLNIEQWKIVQASKIEL